ncbi:glycosyltransferase [Heterostelium album PN500]|uniref:Glycosyltransferase n=1 Tax=Heterostelium pallidum (strain ATCC 26659 / Pp 5 / PN500) TaxID=670386 RepID=D3B3Q9_HETP5|nr:glycosyltransferase [Heterostelium album PN500]EFA83957.1 glycosyltransferase [Heterostelium album PN500]|eukprot:XP_020436074.1 glycosyltransferase [Heterostelium album PN500]
MSKTTMQTTIAQDGDSSKAVHVSLVSNWENTPLYLESFMFFKERVDNVVYNKYIEQLAKSVAKRSYSELSDKQKYDIVIDAATTVLGDDTQFYIGALRADLTMRTFSPKVELLRQLYLSAMTSNNIAIGKSSVPLIQIGSQTIHQNLNINAIDQALKSIVVTEKNSNNNNNNTQVYSFDTIIGNDITFDSQLLVDNGRPIVIYYGNVFSVEFLDVHSHLVKLATGSDAKITYVLRFTVESSEQPAKLQGYGYGLTIKNLEYKVMDDSVIAQDEKNQDASGNQLHEDVAGFNFKVLQDRHPQLLSTFKTFRKFLLAHQQTTDLKVWEIKDIGLQSAQKIISSSDPMRSMKFITSTFPSLARSLSRISLNDSLKQHVEQNHKFLTAGANQLFLNDLNIDLEEEFALNPIGLNEIIYNEIKSKLETKKLDLQSSLITKATNTMSKMNPVRFDIVPEDDTIFYINNVEKDYTYQRWDKSFSAIENGIDQNSVYIAKNIFTGIFMIDMDSDDAYQTLGQINMMINNNLPMRIGIIFATDRAQASGVKPNPAQVPNEAIIKVFASFWRYMGQRAAFYFMNALNYYRQQYDINYVTHSLMQGAFQTVTSQMHNRIPGGLHMAMENPQMDAQLVAGNQYIASKGIANFPQLFVNGMIVDLKKGNPLETLMSLVQEEMAEVKKLVDQRIIDDSTQDIYKTIMSHYRETTGLMSNFNPIIIPSESSPLKYVSLAYSSDAAIQQLANQVLNTDIIWFESTTEIKALSTFVVGDFDESSSSIKLALNALDRFSTDAKPNNQVRYALLSTGNGVVSKVLSHPQITIQGAIDLLTKQAQILEDKSTPLTLDQALAAAKLSNNPLLNQRNQNQLTFIKEYIGLPMTGSQTTIIVNGRVLTVEENDVFNEFYFLECYELSKARKVLSDILENPSADDKPLTNSQYSTILMRLMSSLGKRNEDTTIAKKQPPSGITPSFTYETNNNIISGLLRFTMIVNPLSKQAQKIIPIVAEFAQHYGIPCDVYLNVQLALSEMPLKNYYTYVVQLDNAFDSATGKVVSEPGGTLVNLPESRVLTLAMDAPVDWIVSPIVAKYDLDNIRLKDLGSDKVMRAVYALEHLLVQGSALDISNYQPPGGLELQLSSLNSKVSTDTIVMGNGYFQLQGNPGIWTLDTIGRGVDIFDTLNLVDRKASSLKNAHSVPHLLVYIESFRGSNAFLGLKRKQGQEATPVLPPVEDNQDQQQPEEEIEESYFFNWMKGNNNKKEKAPAKVSSTNETIHVFSVASGHLYERFLKIMMLSVKKNTNNPVKFWFLKNYLSPKFVDFIPFFAKKYGFDYELVTYQWPPWLRAQTEKQRIIWAYKILFLDVLFPLDVKKVIFVDADQVVRTDLKELWDMNLQGAALGYTPFCDSNKDTEGFRFWKSGFWRDHLRGKPYHISALYVIDLQRFRRIIAGDNLRMTYDQLSRDPNSLANLDQDLPNYLQHSVKIFSLPQEWLWCETWCSQASKSKAKTIDLCNNPMTKTPKLENAVRIIDEWTTLDNEAKGVEKEYEQLKSTKSQNKTPTSSTVIDVGSASQTVATTKYEETLPNQDVINQALIDAANEFI